MKKRIIIALLTLLYSCSKSNYCASCISEDSQGFIQNVQEVCSDDQSYTDGYVSGFKKTAQNQGHTAFCTKYIDQ